MFEFVISSLIYVIIFTGSEDRGRILFDLFVPVHEVTEHARVRVHRESPAS